MKQPFIVSTLPDFRLNEDVPPYYLSPYVAHCFERLGKRLEGDKAAPYLCQNGSEQERLVSWVRERHLRYIDILAPRLNAIHGTQFSREFWHRSLSMGFERFIIFTMEMFLTADTYFNPDKHTGLVMTNESLYTPVDPDEQRWFVEHRDFGRQQLFSEYLKEFYPGDFSEVSTRYDSDYQVRQIRLSTGLDPVVGIMGAWFAEGYLRELVNETQGRIHLIGFTREVFQPEDALELSKRIQLTAPIPGADEFDRYFFRCLRFLMPRTFVEHFHANIISIRSQFSYMKNLKYVVSEMWVGEGIEPLALALLREDMGVQLIYNEHNYIEYPFRGSLSPRWAELCDVYAAHGDYAEHIGDNAKSLGLLYDFGKKSLPDDQKNKFDLTYINGRSFASDGGELSGSAISAGNGWASMGKYKSRRAFFGELSDEAKSVMHFRGYPTDDYAKYWDAFYDDELILGDLLKGIERADFSLTGQQTILASKLVVIDYFYTSALEALALNVPTVILCAMHQEYFAVAFKDTLKDLIEVGIVQTDPVQAAHFVEKVRHAPLQWWEEPEVQKAKDAFLKLHTGDPALMLDYLKGLATE